MKAPQKHIAIDAPYYDRLVEQARKGHRTIADQVRYLIDGGSAAC